MITAAASFAVVSMPKLIEAEENTFDPLRKEVWINKGFRPGGPDNPLGARALYLYQNGVDTCFRIHGTTQPRTIGSSVSNGCIRMPNGHVQDLYDRVPVGTKVTVL